MNHGINLNQAVRKIMQNFDENKPKELTDWLLSNDESVER